ncbi:hypothetical protein AB0A74_28835 [Saccharothrix sp. NPDC042600]|uniref:hypothetical protein n=1 Tax=Saccharothrix TaxID=2071 RepID=UPI0033D3E352|nr:hypothetical protein GCM10017745_15520 [Saccharothrix mutabilis subsp. capreolus]
MTGPVRNELSGEATTVVQAGSITGGVHFGALGRPAPTARVIAEWHPFDLDVHPAITVGAGRLPDLPPYVRRAHDDEVDALSGARRSAMVVLTGESSTGKTRALYEAVLRHFADWPVVYPRTAEDLLVLLERGVPARTVLWLNETQNHLTEEAAAALRGLLEGPGPVVVLGTLWPEYWARFVAEPSHVRSLLQHKVSRVRVASSFSAELVAAARGSDDPRLRRAVAASGEGRKVIQTMSGGPMLVECYEHPDTPDDRYATAIVTAALDARRLGHRALLTSGFLVDAAPGYLSDEDRVDAPEDWFERGMHVAAQDRTGIAALLPKRISAGVGPPDGYDIHDYLDQHARTSRRWALTPTSFWDALVAHTTDPEDQFRLARNAFHRLRHRHGSALHRTAAAHSSAESAAKMLDVLVDHRQADDVAALLAANPHVHSTEWVGAAVRAGLVEEVVAWLRRNRKREVLATVLADHGRWDEALHVVRESTGSWIDRWLAERFAAAGNTERLRWLAAAGSPHAARHLAEDDLVNGRVEQGVIALRSLLEKQISMIPQTRLVGSMRLFELLLDHGEEELAVALAVIPAERFDAVHALVDAFAGHGRRDRAIEAVRGLMANDDRNPLRDLLLLELLAAEGRWAEALHLARATGTAAGWVPTHLAKVGNAAKLRELADGGSRPAQVVLAALLAERGQYAELEDRARRGDQYAAKRVVERYDVVSERSRSGSR